MKKMIQVLSCFIAPLKASNILFLSKQRRVHFAGFLLKLHLRLFYSLDTAGLEQHPDLTSLDIDHRIVHALGNLGFVKLNSQLRGAIKSEADIHAGNDKYPTGGKIVDQQLKSLIHGKTVAIVGPAHGADNEEEIDSFDYVVRMGFVGSNGFPANTGQRCDISFYAPHKMRKIIDNDQIGFLRELKLPVLFKLDRYPRHGIDLKKIQPELPPFAVALLPPFHLTVANTLVKAIYNCILCEPERIKVFNADLFLSTFYPAGYLVNKRVDSDGERLSYKNRDMCKSFAKTHNPSEQHEFYQYYYHLGAFEADTRLGEIIRLSAEEYLDRIDRIYGYPLRKQYKMI
jgi:hypothetical protein